MKAASARRAFSFGTISVLLAVMTSDGAHHPPVLGIARVFHLNAGQQDLIGYIASALVLTAFAMQKMRSLRITAIASNVAFIIYSSTAHLYPILILHSILLPLNIFRLVQIEKPWGHEQLHRKS